MDPISSDIAILCLKSNLNQFLLSNRHLVECVETSEQRIANCDCEFEEQNFAKLFQRYLGAGKRTTVSLCICPRETAGISCELSGFH